MLTVANIFHTVEFHAVEFHGCVGCGIPHGGIPPCGIPRFCVGLLGYCLISYYGSPENKIQDNK